MNKLLRKMDYGMRNVNENITSDVTHKHLNFGLNNRHKIKLNLKFNQDDDKNTCERKFEELETKWETAGQIHRQKVQEIKENFKNEVYLIKENEKEYELRRKRIQLLREKYVEHLKNDREKYLTQLQKLREERQKIMTYICHQKSKDIYLKDASVGNYAVLLPDSYSFQQKIQLLKKQNNEVRISLPSIPTASFPKLGAVKNSKFIRYQSIPDIPKQESPREKSTMSMDSTDWRREKYLQRVKKYYERKSKYLQNKGVIDEKQNKINTTRIAESIGEALIEDIMSHMASNISQHNETLYTSSSNSSVETVKAERSSENISSIEVPNASSASVGEDKMETGFKLVVKKRPKKQDLYDLAFDRNSKKVKQEDMTKWSERKERVTKLQQHQILSKQDPQKAFKEKIVVKAHI